jgi:hypothetical protein
VENHKVFEDCLLFYCGCWLYFVKVASSTHTLYLGLIVMYMTFNMVVFLHGYFILLALCTHVPMYPCTIDFVTNNKHHNTTKYSKFVAKSHTWAEEIDWDHTMQPVFDEEIDFMPLRCKHHPECDILACFWLRVDGWSCSYIYIWWYQNWFSDFLRTAAVMRSKSHHPGNPASGFMLSWIPAQHLYSLFTIHLGWLL